MVDWIRFYGAKPLAIIECVLSFNMGWRILVFYSEPWIFSILICLRVLWLEDGYLYLRLRNMSHTIYAAKFEQTIMQQHVHLRRESQSHTLANVLMRLQPIDKSLVFYKAKKGRHARIVYRTYDCNPTVINMVIFSKEHVWL